VVTGWISVNKKMKNLQYLLLFTLVVLTSACATPSEFIYPEISKSTLYNEEKLVCELEELKDKRTQQKEIDKIYKNPPVIEIQKILQKELINSGFFTEIHLATEIPNDHAGYLIKPSLVRLEWEVPDYDNLVGTTFVVSLLTGGIGGLVYASTSTDVFGYVDLEIELYDLSTENLLTKKIYKGLIKQNMAKLSSDTPETKATIIGLAAQSAINQFKEDLLTLLPPAGNY
jgi:hypothetical protein